MVDIKHGPGIDPSKLASLLGAVVGSEQVTVNPNLEIDGLRPAVIATPGTRQEVAACLRVCADADAAVLPAGRNSCLEWGNPLQRLDVVLSLTRMNRIIEYSPADLTATVEAGITLREFNEAARPERQWLPLDPPGASTASLGAIAACASSGPLRFGFGTPRDYVIGLRIAHADGTESKCGGKVVKNVAGYDMNKLYVGSYGTLGILTELIFKLRPLPEQASTLEAAAEDYRRLYEAGVALVGSELQLASVFLARGPGASRDTRMFVRAVDCREAVDYQMAEVRRLTTGCETRLLDETRAIEVWTGIANLGSRLSVLLRVSVPLARTVATFERICQLEPAAAVAADLGAGIIRFGCDAEPQSLINLIQSLRSELRVSGGTLTVEKAPLKLRAAVDVWGDPQPAAAIMRALKSSFDPTWLLCPGRFVAGI